MKKANISFNINVSDDFQCGDCKHCPMRKEDYIKTGFQEVEKIITCKMGFESYMCPIEILSAIKGEKA